MKAGDKVVIFATVVGPGQEYSAVKFDSGTSVVIPTSDMHDWRMEQVIASPVPQLDRIEATLASILKAVTPTQLPPGEIAGMKTEGPGASAPPQFSDDPAVAALQREWLEKNRQYQALYNEIGQTTLFTPKRDELQIKLEALRDEIAELQRKIERAQKQ